MDMLEFTDKLRNWHLWHTPSSFQRPMDNSLQMAILCYHYQGDVVLVLQIPCKSISLTSRRLSIVFTWWVSPYTTSSTTYVPGNGRSCVSRLSHPTIIPRWAEGDGRKWVGHSLTVAKWVAFVVWHPTTIVIHDNRCRGKPERVLGDCYAFNGEHMRVLLLRNWLPCHQKCFKANISLFAKGQPFS